MLESGGYTLTFSQKLYGRESQLKQLFDTFNRVNQGDTEYLLVSGYSGIGKSSLVRELYHPLVSKHRYFTTGKFDQLQRSTPYSAFIEAFQGLLEYLLLEPEDKLQQLRQSLLDALGKNGQVIIDVVPKVALLIGPQPPVIALTAAEAQNRFMFTLQNFIRALAQPEHPFVLFLDDLQWIDSASLQLIHLLLANPELHHFLLIGAYRDNEVSIEHPLTLALEQIRKSNITLNQIVLTPLAKIDIQNMLAESFNCTTSVVDEFADLLLIKTNGNPFFINEFLRLLYQKKLLIFSYKEKQWQWDMQLIAQEPITDNVVDLLTMRIQQLPEATQKILQLAACIGHIFDLQTLAIISQKTNTEVFQSLDQAIAINLLKPLGDSHRTSLPLKIIFSEDTDPALVRYQFLHDRIQQAAYQLIPDPIKQEVHLEIGRLLLKGKSLQENDEKLFDIVDHFSQSLKLITDEKEKKQLAEYFFWAGKKAKSSTAYQAARSYLQMGVDLLQPINWKLESALTFNLYKELAACQYLTGEFEAAETKFGELLLHTKSNLQKLEIYRLNCEMLATVNKHTEALKLGLQAVKLVGINLPIKANTFRILKTIFKIKLRIGRRKVAEIELVPVKIPEYRAAIDLISQLFNSAFVTDQNLFILLACSNVNLSLKYGYTDSGTFAIVVYSFVIMHALNRYHEGISFVELYNKLAQKYVSPNFAGKNHLVLGAFIDQWRFPVDVCLQTLAKGYQYSYEVGDLLYANYCNILSVLTSSMLGQPLSEFEKYVKITLNFINKTKSKDFHNVALFFEDEIQVLKNNIFDEKQLKSYENNILTDKNNTELSFFYSQSTKLCYLLGRYKKAQELGDKHEHYAEYAIGMLSKLEGRFYYVLAIMADVDNKKKLSPKSSKLLKKIVRQMRRWSSWYSANYQHYLFLLQAELARLNGKFLPAIRLYKKAIVSAQEKNSMQIVAIANECISRFYMSLQLPDLAKPHFQNAYQAYQNLEITTKCRLLEQEYPEIFPVISKIPSLKEVIPQKETALDVISILKSTQIISSEIHLEELLQKLLYILLQNSSAQRGALIVREGEEWFVEAEGNMSIQKINLSRTEYVEKRKDLPISLIKHVQQTQEKILIQNIQELEPYLEKDYYLQHIKPLSLLLLPIRSQGIVNNILFLENKDSSYVFTPEKLEAIELLALQAAISLENGQLFYQATHDPLTGLANRNLLHQKFNDAVSKAKRNNKLIAILLFDIDDFKKVNDSLGHEVGDKLLIKISKELKLSLREGDLAARLGGDEFVVMLENIDSTSQIKLIAEKILQLINQPLMIMDHEMYVSASMGISTCPQYGDDIQDLLRQADTALYNVKGSGKNKYQFYTLRLYQKLQEVNAEEIELRQALEKEELCLCYQPIFTSHNRQLSSFEALVCWIHPKRGLLTAKKFIPLAEKTGLILPIGEWVLKTACRQIKTWQTMNLAVVPIAVNISGLQFHKQRLSQLISNILDEIKIDPKYLALELTESMFIEYGERIVSEIADLKRLNVKFSIDDFGTHYASFSYLRRFEVDKIKIDQSFVKDIAEDENDRILIIAMITMAHSLKLQVVAEGVETERQLNFLEENGVDELQGYYLGMPMNGKECTALLIQNNSSKE